MPMFELIDKNGKTLVEPKFPSAQAAALWAFRNWPDIGQDPERSGAGWDVQEISADAPASRASHYS